MIKLQHPWDEDFLIWRRRVSTKIKLVECYNSSRVFTGFWVKEGDFNWFIPVGHFVGIYEGELISIEPDAISKPIESLPNMRGNVASKLCGEAKV